MSIDRGSADVEGRFSQDSHRGQPHGGHAMLIDAMRERAVAESWTFTLLIPNEPRKGGADWTLKTATPLLERLATADYLPSIRHTRLPAPTPWVR